MNEKISEDAAVLLNLLSKSPTGGMLTWDLMKATGWTRQHVLECMKELVKKGFADFDAYMPGSAACN